MTSVTDRLKNTRGIYRGRGEARTGKDIGFAVYIVAMGALLLVFPVLSWTVLLLVEPSVFSMLTAPSAGHMAGVVCGLVLVAAAAAGQVGGPVALSPFFVTLLAGTDISRGRALRRPFFATTVIVALGALAIGLLFSGVLVFTGASSFLAGLVFVLACVAFSVLVSVVWLASQCMTSWTWVLPTLLLAATVLTAVVDPLMVYMPWGWVGGLWPTQTDLPPWPLIPLGITTVIGGVCVPRILNALQGERLREQGQQWRSASTAAQAGDFATAFAGFRAKPSLGRRWTAVPRSPLFVRFFLRDLIGAMRTPARCLAGVGVLIFAYWVIALAFVSGPWPGWLPAGIGAALGYLALGVLCDGFRHAAEAAGSPPLYGYTTAKLYLLHSLFPLALSLVGAVIGIGLATHGGVPVGSAGAVVAVAVLLVLVRAYDSAKGPLPMSLLTPAPSPVGDTSGLAVLSWQADALLIATIAGTVIISVTTTETVFHGLLVASLAAGFVLSRLRRRLAGL